MRLKNYFLFSLSNSKNNLIFASCMKKTNTAKRTEEEYYLESKRLKILKALLRKPRMRGGARLYLASILRQPILHISVAN